MLEARVTKTLPDDSLKIGEVVSGDQAVKLLQANRAVPFRSNDRDSSGGIEVATVRRSHPR